MAPVMASRTATGKERCGECRGDLWDDVPASMRFVEIKTCDQGTLVLHRERLTLVRQRVRVECEPGLFGGVPPGRSGRRQWPQRLIAILGNRDDECAARGPRLTGAAGLSVWAGE